MKHEVGKNMTYTFVLSLQIERYEQIWSKFVFANFNLVASHLPDVAHIFYFKGV